MKDKAIVFIVGLLVGAIISTGSVLAYVLASGSNSATVTTVESGSNSGMQGSGGQEPGGTPPDMQTNGGTNNGGTNTPPARPDQNNNSQNN